MKPIRSGIRFKNRDAGLIRLVPKSLALVAIVGGLLSSNNAQAVDSFFDVFVELSESGQVVMQPVDSGAFPFPPPPLNFPDIPTASGLVDIELVALSLVSISSSPMVVGPLDPTGSFQVDSFFDITYSINATDSTGNTTFNVDSFFDIAYSISVTPEPPVVLPGGEVFGTWDTEIVSMNLTGRNPVDLFGDPDFDIAIQLTGGQASKADGHVTVLKSPLPGGGDTFTVDSFFDVFVEISVDGGPLVPSLENSPLRLQSQNVITVVPEPSALLLGVMASVGLLMRRKRR